MFFFYIIIRRNIKTFKILIKNINYIIIINLIKIIIYLDLNHLIFY